jgi:hypothetical protein
MQNKDQIAVAACEKKSRLSFFRLVRSHKAGAVTVLEMKFQGRRMGVVGTGC